MSFTVDAYPLDRFTGRVEQVRLNPVVASNVVTYAAIISAPNLDLKLKPGMTASLNVEIARRDDVLRVPAAALRFKPTADVLKLMNATPAAKSPAGGGTVWKVDGGTATPVTVRLGVSDGPWTELLDAPFAEGTQLVTTVETGAASASRTTPAAKTTSPLMGNQPGGPRGR